jgi:hypothetical protein
LSLEKKQLGGNKIMIVEGERPMSEKEQLVNVKKQEVSNEVKKPQTRRGFEDEQQGDVIMPRAKVLQATSPELADDNLQELLLRAGDIVNSLTKEKLNGVFIPIFKFNSKVLWIAKEAGGGMACRSFDGILGTVLDASKFGKYNKDTKKWDILLTEVDLIKKVDGIDTVQKVQLVNSLIIPCAECPFSKWNGDEPPICTAAMNFLSIFEGQSFPVVTSFTNTSHKYGKKLYSMAKMMGGDMFENKYRLKPVRTTNEKGTFFVMDVYPAGKPTVDEVDVVEGFYNALKGIHIKFDEEEVTAGNPDSIQNSVTDEM